MEKRKRIRKTIRMVLKDAKRERLENEQVSYARNKGNRKRNNE